MKPKERLEYLRQQLRAEHISYDELHELQSLAKHIEPGDVELLEAAGVPEFGRFVFANDDSGKWDVRDNGCWLAQFESQSEAQLYAAAPDLLAALENLMAEYIRDRTDDVENEDEAYKQAAAAIAKAVQP